MNSKKRRNNYYISIVSLTLCVIILLLGILAKSVFFTIVGIIFLILSLKSLRINKHKSELQRINSDLHLQTNTKNISCSSSSSPAHVIPEVKLEPIDISDIIDDSSSTITKTENHRVTGISHYLTNILSLANENYQYDLTKKEMIDECLDGDKIYQYDFHPEDVELIPDPENEYDPNAVKVVINHVLVGYIKKGSCSHIKKLLSSGKIKNIEADIHGGKYKYLSYDDYEDSYELEKGEDSFFITLTIYIN